MYYIYNLLVHVILLSLVALISLVAKTAAKFWAWSLRLHAAPFLVSCSLLCL